MQLTKWNLIERKSIIDTKWIKVYEEKLETSNGKKIEPWYSIKYQTGSVLIAVTPSKEILVIQQYRRGCDDLNFEFPGGGIEEDEDCREGALRELKEETGYEVLNDPAKDVIQLGPPIYEDVNRNSCSSHGYLVYVKEEPSSKQNVDEHEEIHVQKLKIKEIFDLMDRGLIRSSIHISYFYRALKEMGVLQFNL
ncbi:hypothetical protein ABK040_008586 [Willaertia magna]